MPEKTPGAIKPEDARYKLYVLKTPQAATGAAAPSATEQRLIDDLHMMDADGWEIAHVFASGTHILMTRKADWKPPQKETK